MIDTEDGKPNSRLKRIDKNYLINEFRSILNLEKGFLLTVRNLVVKPGVSIREFLFEDRKKYVKPILFLILTSVIFSILIGSLNIQFSLFNIDNISLLKGKLRSKEIGEWSQNNLGYSQLIMGVFVGFWIKLLYRKSNYNLYEILVLLSFVLGEAFVILGVFIFLAVIFKSTILGIAGVIIYLVYIIWAIGQFFGENQIKNYLKSLISYLLGSATYMVALILLGYVLNFI